MPADQPTILATSGGAVDGRRTPWEVGPLTRYAVELAGVSGRRPRVCFVPTAMGDHPGTTVAFYDAARIAGFEASHLALFPMPNIDDVREPAVAHRQRHRQREPAAGGVPGQHRAALRARPPSGVVDQHELGIGTA